MAQHLDFFDIQMKEVSSCETLVTIYKTKQSRFQEKWLFLYFKLLTKQGLIWKRNLRFKQLKPHIIHQITKLEYKSLPKWP